MVLPLQDSINIEVKKPDDEESSNFINIEVKKPDDEENSNFITSKFSTCIANTYIHTLILIHKTIHCINPRRIFGFSLTKVAKQH